MRKFFAKHARLWGGLCIALSLAVSNLGSAWAGAQYELLSRNPWENSAPALVGFQILCWTAYPAAIGLMVLGVWLWNRHGRQDK